MSWLRRAIAALLDWIEHAIPPTPSEPPPVTPLPEIDVEDPKSEDSEIPDDDKEVEPEEETETYEVLMLLRLHNNARQSVGSGPLELSTALMSLAQRQADYQASIGRVTHARPSGGSFQRDISRLGVTHAGENVAGGYRTPQAVMQGWQNSPGHRRNLLSPNYRHAGFGAATRGSTIYWTAIFATFRNTPASISADDVDCVITLSGGLVNEE